MHHERKYIHYVRTNTTCEWNKAQTNHNIVYHNSYSNICLVLMTLFSIYELYTKLCKEHVVQILILWLEDWEFKSPDCPNTIDSPLNQPKLLLCLDSTLWIEVVSKSVKVNLQLTVNKINMVV